MKLPHSCVIFLRSGKNTPDKLTMHIEGPDGGELKFDAPVLKLRDYTRDEIIRKRLLILLPYYLMRYEKELREIGELPPERQGEADRRMDRFIAEYAGVCRALEESCSESEKGYFCQTLAELVAEIAQAVKVGVDTVRQWLEGGVALTE